MPSTGSSPLSATSNFNILSGFCILGLLAAGILLNVSVETIVTDAPVSMTKLVSTPHNNSGKVIDSSPEATKQDTSVISLLGTKVWLGDPVPSSFPPACWHQLLMRQWFQLSGIHGHSGHVDDTCSTLQMLGSAWVHSWPSLAFLSAVTSDH